MERLAKLPLFIVVRNYCRLTKPGIILGNVINAAVGIVLASRGDFSASLFWGTLTGLSCVIASACIYNNYIDRDCDKKMTRTRQRVLAQGLVPVSYALLLASSIGLVGFLLLAAFANSLAVAVALAGFFIYVAIYSFVKYRSSYATLIGSFAGATPPVIGYCAVTERFDLTALLLFALIVTWQMPHFFAIAIYRLEDYAAAKIPVLPLAKGIQATKLQMIAYIFAFVAVSSMFTLFGYVGYLHLIVTALLGIGWIWLGFCGIKCANDNQWARKMFFFSLVVIMTLCMTIPFSAF
ncbi:MAG: heme o synthase [Chlamydiota bacterium]